MSVHQNHFFTQGFPVEIQAFQKFDGFCIIRKYICFNAMHMIVFKKCFDETGESFNCKTALLIERKQLVSEQSTIVRRMHNIAEGTCAYDDIRGLLQSPEVAVKTAIQKSLCLRIQGFGLILRCIKRR